MNQERLMKIIVAPVISEKATLGYPCKGAAVILAEGCVARNLGFTSQ